MMKNYMVKSGAGLSLAVLALFCTVYSCNMVNNTDLDARVRVKYCYNSTGTNTDGTHTMKAESWIAGKWQNLAKNVFTASLPGGTLDFLGWSTSADSPKIVFSDGESASFMQDINLYAVWGVKDSESGVDGLYNALNKLNTLCARDGSGLGVQNYSITLDSPGTSDQFTGFVVPGGSITLGSGTLTTSIGDVNWYFPAIKAVNIYLSSTGTKGSGNAGSSGDTRVLMPASNDTSFWKLPAGSSVSYKNTVDNSGNIYGIVTADGFDGQDGIVLDKNGKVRMRTAVVENSGAFEIDTVAPLDAFKFSADPNSHAFSTTGDYINMRVYGSTAWGKVLKATGAKITDSFSLPVASGQQKARSIFIRNSNLCVSADKLNRLFYENTTIRALKGDISNLYGSPLTAGDLSTSNLMGQTACGCSSLRSIGQLVFGSLSDPVPGPLSSNQFNATFSNCLNLTGESAKINYKGTFVPLYTNITLSGGTPYGNDAGLSDWAAIVTAGWN